MDFEQLEKTFLLELQRAFSQAQSTNEFAFIHILLGYDGAIGDPRALNHLYESEQLFIEFSKLVKSNPGDFVSIRTGLFLYCHFFEMNQLYKIIGNVLHIVKGNEFQVGLFSEWASDDNKNLYPTMKIERLKKIALECKMDTLIECLNELYFNRLRNSFFHSDYSIVDDDYYFVSNKPIQIGGSSKYSLSIKEFLFPLVQTVINIAEGFFGMLSNFKMQYVANKIIIGRFPNMQPIIIIGHAEKGLIGFETLNGSSIMLTEFSGQPFLSARNITVSWNKGPSELEKRLTALVDKNHYRNNDPEFIKLENDIKAANDEKLIRDLAIPYFNWGNNISLIAEDNATEKGKINLYKVALKKFDISLEYNRELGPCIYNRNLTLLHLKKLGEPILDSDRKIADNFDNVIKLIPDMPEVYEPAAYHFAAMARDEGNIKQSIELFEKSAQLFEKAEVHNATSSNLFHNATGVYIRLIQLDNDHTQDYLERGRKHIEQAIAINPDNIDHHLEYATLLENAAIYLVDAKYNYLREANSHIDKAIEINSQLPRAHFKKGINLFFLSFETPENAEKILIESTAKYKEAIEINDLNDLYFNNLGLAQYYLGLHYNDDRSEVEINNAIASLNQALVIKKDKKESLLNLGRCYFLLFKRFHRLKDESLLLENFELASKLGENVNLFLLAYYCFKKDKEKSLYYLEKHKKDPEFALNALQEDEDMAFVLGLEEAKEITKLNRDQNTFE